MPNFQDFIVEPLDQGKQYSTYEYGSYYQVFEQSYALFPTKVGIQNLPPAKLNGVRLYVNDPFDSLFGNAQQIPFELVTEPMTIDVKKLPKAPANFKNSVGLFKINTEISTMILRTGDTAKLTINIWGSGNITNIQAPQFNFDDNFKSCFKIYEQTPKTQITDKRDYIIGRKTFDFDIVALKPGTYTIPSAEYAYFNPETGLYHQLKSSEIKITVKPGSSNEQVNLASSDNNPDTKQDEHLDDIISIHTNDNIIVNKAFTKISYTIYAVLFAIPLIALLATLLYIKHKESTSANEHLIKKRLAYRTAKERLSKIKPIVKQGNNKEFFFHLDNIIKDYIGSKLYLPSGSLTSKDVETQLKKNNVSQKTIIFIAEILKLCEQSEYSTDKNTLKKVAIAYKDAKKVLKSLDKELK